MTQTLNAKVIVVGGGPAGLAMAAVLAMEGVPTMLVAPDMPKDPRTVALMQPSLRLLERLGVWPGGLSLLSAPLRVLEIIDEMGNLISAPKLSFSSHELGLEAFGWNIPLDGLVPELAATAAALGVEMVSDTVTRSEDVGAVVAIDTARGQRFYGEVLVAADGANSLLRANAGIEVDQWHFDQAALVTSFHHSGPHRDVSTERHRPGGAFTTVPLPGQSSSLVWMGKPPLLESLVFRTGQELAREIQLATHGALGLVSQVSPPRVFPMRGVKARHFAGGRTLLVGEAAHTFPPIGAQGLNMSFRDVGHALDVVLGADDMGADSVLEAYHNTRARDVFERQAVILAMNTSLLAEFLPLDLMRVGALSAISAFPPLRSLVMRQGLAPEGMLPFTMRR
jgi:2-octaprenyl-6-methoxyphenol hydroxylase